MNRAKAHVLQLLADANNFYTISYTDDKSVETSSYQDLLITCTQRVVGCGMSKFENAQPGDIVLVKAACGKGTSHADVFCVGVLGKPVGECHAWRDKGGKVWKYNFEFTPLTRITDRDPNDIFLQRCTQAGVPRPNNIYNPLFANKENLLPFLNYMVEHDHLRLI